MRKIFSFYRETCPFEVFYVDGKEKWNMILKDHNDVEYWVDESENGEYCKKVYDMFRVIGPGSENVILCKNYLKTKCKGPYKTFNLAEQS